MVCGALDRVTRSLGAQWLARTLHEVRVLATQARKTKVSTQMGNQCHTFDWTKQLREYVEAVRAC